MVGDELVGVVVDRFQALCKQSALAHPALCQTSCIGCEEVKLVVRRVGGL
jgi:hypothetical protein